MALHLNLLHEEITEHRQRQRDPIKIGLMAVCLCGVLMAVFYSFKAYQTLNAKARLSAVQREWAAVESSVTAAQTRAKELSTIISTTRVLDEVMEGRFFWAPLLEQISRSVAPNTQLISFSGGIEGGLITVSLEGLAAGREPRAAAEELRQLLTEQLGASYEEVKVEFRSLEDLDTLINVAGTNMPVARYGISLTLTQPKNKDDSPRRRK